MDCWLLVCIGDEIESTQDLASVASLVVVDAIGEFIRRIACIFLTERKKG